MSTFQEMSPFREMSPLKEMSPFKEMSLSVMGLLNGHADPTPKDLLEPILLSNPMGPCAVRQAIPCMRKSEDGNHMALCVCCMLLVCAIAAPALCVHSVKKTAPQRSSPAGSVLCSYHFLPLPFHHPHSLHPIS